LDVPVCLDPVESEKSREVQRDMLDAFGNMLKNEKPPVSMGSQKDLDDCHNGLTLGVYGEMEGGANFTPKQKE
jgi:hypothetical protein